MNAYLIDGGPAFSWRGLVTFGAGAGVIRLEATAPDDETYVVTRFQMSGRLTISPFRIIDEAIDKFLDRPPSSDKWMGILKLYYKPTVVAGRFSGADLGVPGVECNCGNERLDSYGISFDFLELTSFGAR